MTFLKLFPWLLSAVLAVLLTYDLLQDKETSSQAVRSINIQRLELLRDSAKAVTARQDSVILAERGLRQKIEVQGTERERVFKSKISALDRRIALRDLKRSNSTELDSIRVVLYTASAHLEINNRPDTVKMYCLPLVDARKVFTDALNGGEQREIISAYKEEIEALKADNSVIKKSLQTENEAVNAKLNANLIESSQKDLVITDCQEANQHLKKGNKVLRGIVIALVGWVAYKELKD